MSKPFIHPSAFVDENVKIGNDTKIWHCVHVMKDVEIGEGCVLGQNVFVSNEVKIGNRVRIQNNVSVYHGVILEDDVFCGPSMVFTNVLRPRAAIQRTIGEYLPTIVKRGASLGANSTIICGNDIGRYAMVGAGSVVIREVNDYAMMCGNPAKLKGIVCECGEVLLYIEFERMVPGELKCSLCSKKYKSDIKMEIIRNEEQ